MHQSFIRYKNYRYAVYSGFISIIAILIYALEDPRQPPNGGTTLGYTYGSMAAIMVICLLWFGIRKRSYHSTFGSVTGWLSMHIYLGQVLLLFATLHCGFQFGWNIHTLAYVLMCLIIASGCWGVYTYLKYPGLLVRQRGGASREMIFQTLKDLDERALSLALTVDSGIYNIVLDAIQRSTIGGNLWAQLSAYDGSMLLVETGDSAHTAKLVHNKKQQVLIEILAGKLAHNSDVAKIDCIQDLLEITGKRAALLRKLQKKIQLQSLLQFWLYLHIPLSFAFLIALIIHITSVFIYW